MRKMWGYLEVVICVVLFNMYLSIKSFSSKEQVKKEGRGPDVPVNREETVEELELAEKTNPVSVIIHGRFHFVWGPRAMTNKL